MENRHRSTRAARPPPLRRTAAVDAGAASARGAVTGTGGGAASGGSASAMRPASVSIDDRSSSNSRKVTFTPKALCTAVHAWVRKSESSPSSRKLADGSRLAASRPERSAKRR